MEDRKIIENEESTETVILETLSNVTSRFLCDHAGKDAEEFVALRDLVGCYINMQTFSG